MRSSSGRPLEQACSGFGRGRDGQSGTRDGANQEGHAKSKYAVPGLLSLAAVGLLVPQTASAVPNGLPHANQISNVEQVRWVCNP